MKYQILTRDKVAQWKSVRLDIEGSLVRVSMETLCCVLEQDIVIVLVQPR